MRGFDLRRTPAAVALLALLAVAPPASAKAPDPPVRLTAAFGPGARLGGEASVRVGIRIDSRRLSSPITDVQVLTPVGLDLTTSQLGVANCRRPEGDYVRVVRDGPAGELCPENALLGVGTATAELRLSGRSSPVEGTARLRLYSAVPRKEEPGLVLLVDTVNPVSTQLVYAGQLAAAPRPFGLAIGLAIPAIPSPPLGATVALVGMQFTLGGPEIVYSRKEHGRRIHYRPGGLGLPTRCPSGGFRFRLRLAFADASRSTVDASLPCPRRRARG